MVYKRFSIVVIVRIAFMLINMTLIARYISMPNRLFSSLVFILILIGQIYELLHFINKTNRSLSYFLDTIKDKDYSATSNIELVDKSFKSLNQSFKGIAQTIFNSKIEKEAQFQLLKVIIDKVQPGILLYDCDHANLTLMNQSATKMLNLNPEDSFKTIQKKVPGISELFTTPFAGKKTVDLDLANEKLQYLVHSSPLKLVSKQYILLTFHNIQEELDNKEIESWQKLLRTLSHEIMNSVTPIISLTETSLMQVQHESGDLKARTELNETSIAKIQKALKTIEKRTSGLYQFVDDFRKLAKIPEPTKKQFQVTELFDSVYNLLSEELDKKSSKLAIKLQNQDMNLTADFTLVEQILINLIKNANEASASRIELSAFEHNSNICIEIIDNGTGITKQKINEIFVPFFTTKETGSGIGLSLSRQIMHLHGGTITVKSEPNKATVFTLTF